MANATKATKVTKKAGKGEKSAGAGKAKGVDPMAWPVGTSLTIRRTNDGYKGTATDATNSQSQEETASSLPGLLKKLKKFSA